VPSLAIERLLAQKNGQRRKELKMNLEINPILNDEIKNEALKQLKRGAPPQEVQAVLNEIVTGLNFATPLNSSTEFASIPGRDQLDLSKAQLAQRPELTILPDWQRAILETTLYAIPGVGDVLKAAKLASSEAAVTVGIGPAVSAGVLVGVSAGGGIVFNDREFGLYFSVGAVVGFFASMSLTAQITFVKGGIQNFRGDCYVLGVNVGAFVVTGGGAILLTADANKAFLGVSVQAGLGVGLPLELYHMVERTWTT
jgi:hypothetical protein